jgi:hypothetical protein
MRNVAGQATEDDDRAGLTRRQFARAAAKAGAAVGAGVWIAPQLTSVALAQDAAGSPAPTPTTSVSPPVVTEPVAPAEQVAGPRSGDGTPQPGGGGAGRGGPGAGGQLPFTGANVQKLAITGGAAVVTGSTLIATERLMGKRRPRPRTAPEGSGGETAQ